MRKNETVRLAWHKGSIVSILLATVYYTPKHGFATRFVLFYDLKYNYKFNYKKYAKTYFWFLTLF